MAYDDNDNLVAVAPGGQPAHDTTYSARNLELSYTPAGEELSLTSTTTTWDALARPVTVTFGSAGSVTFGYDAVGRPTTVTEDSAVYDEVVTTTYWLGDGGVAMIGLLDGVDSDVKLAYPEPETPLVEEQTLVDDVLAGTVALERDVEGRLMRRVVSVGAEAPVELVATYDDGPAGTGLMSQFGPVVLTREGPDAVGLLSGVNVGATATTLTRDPVGALARAITTTPLGTVADLTYTRDAAGRITAITGTVEADAVNWTYAYDANGRLTEEENGAAAAIVNTYDANGNRTERDVPGVATYAATYDAQDRLTEDSGRDYEHNDAGQRTRTTALTGEITDYAYDLRGNLRHVVLPDGGEIVYTVDGRGRRIGRRVLDANDDLVSDTTWLYKDQLDPIAERDNLTGAVSVFVYASSRYTPDAMIRGGVTYRFVTDHLGSVRLVLEAATGAVVQRIDYDAWGNITLDTAPEVQPFGFAGGLHDRTTGFVRFGARDYDPATGRWTAKDPIRWGGGQGNLFEYVGSGPTTRIDPSGLDPIIDYLDAFRSEMEDIVKHQGRKPWEPDGDALLHCVGQCIGMLRHGWAPTWASGWANELSSMVDDDVPFGDIWQDIRNNACARDIAGDAQSEGDCISACNAKLSDGSLDIYYDRRGDPSWTDLLSDIVFELSGRGNLNPFGYPL